MALNQTDIIDFHLAKSICRFYAGNFINCFEPVCLTHLPRIQFLSELFQRQTNDVAIRAKNFRDDFFAMFLDCISASLVQRIDLIQIIQNLACVQRMKSHVRASGEKFFAMPAQMDQTDAGDDLMRTPLKPLQHPLRLSQISRLAQGFIFKKDQRVRAQHERIGNFFGDGARLAMRVELANFQRRQMFMRHFHGIARQDFKFHLQLLQ
jgi:hypothetical protein